jgi:hypothetical protein
VAGMMCIGFFGFFFLQLVSQHGQKFDLPSVMAHHIHSTISSIAGKKKVARNRVPKRVLKYDNQNIGQRQSDWCNKCPPHGECAEHSRPNKLAPGCAIEDCTF